MSYPLFLDDERNPRDVTWVAMRKVPWEIVRNYDQFVARIMQYGVPYLVSFDHDLADFHYAAMIKDNDQHTAFVNDEHGGLNVTFDYGIEKTGFDCAKWLVQHCIDTNTQFPEYQVHSMNPVGGQRIRQYIEWAKEKMGI